LMTVQADDGVFRVDGFRGLTDNYGSLYRIMDMRGISPLFLSGPFALIEPDKINPLAWELFAVRYVYTDWQELPVPSEIVASGEDRSGAVNLHRLDDPRPFALLVYDAQVVESDEAAYALLRAPAINPRGTILLNRAPEINLPAMPPVGEEAEIIAFAPESFSIRVSTALNAVLSLAHPDYPGWRVTVDDQPAEILRAYGALSAVAVPAGSHTIRLVFDPMSYRIGAILSLVTWAILGILAGAADIRALWK
jgi:hypothetical protein